MRSLYADAVVNCAAIVRVSLAMYLACISLEGGRFAFAQVLDQRRVASYGTRTAGTAPVGAGLGSRHFLDGRGQISRAPVSAEAQQATFCSVVKSNKPNVLFLAIDDLNDWIGGVGGAPAG